MGVLARGRVHDGTRSAEWLFTDRLDGASVGPYASCNLGASVGDDVTAVAANRTAVAALVDQQQLALVRQVHSREVAVLDAVAEPAPEADAIVTTTLDLPIAVQVADCVPILLADLQGGRIAAVHAGWRGLVADIISATFDILAPQGPVSAWVGPAICPGCYEVGPEVIDEVMRVVPEAAAQTRAGTPAVDVRAGILTQLARYGVSATLVGGCTYEGPHLYSYRRDGVTGRQAGVIVMRDAAS